MNLENRLAAGPMGFMKKKEEVEEEKKEEQEEVKEKEPVLVADVRKGRTKGPRGRKLPTAVSTETKDNEGVKKEEVSVSAPATPPTVAAAPSMGFAMAWTVWSVDEGEPEVVLAEEESKPALPASFEAPPLQEEAAIMGDKGESKSTQEHLAKEVLTEMVDPPAVVHSPGIPTKLPSQEEKTEKKEEVSGPASSGLVKEDSHPEDAAPKGESKLDPEEPAHHPRQAEEKREEERDVITTKEEGEWDVVSKE